jgi:hypothetical protein
MHFDYRFSDTQVTGNLFIQLAGDDMFEHRSNGLTSRELRFSGRLLLAILGDQRSGIVRAAGRGRPPVLAGAGLVAQIEF